MRWIKSIPTSVKTLQGLIVGVGVIVGAASTVISVVFGSGSLALEEAIKEEQAAQEEVVNARGRCAGAMIEPVCESQQVVCDPYVFKNSVETAILDAFVTGTGWVIDEQTRKVHGPEDLSYGSLPELDTSLRIAIELAIRNALKVDVAIVSDSLDSCECFGIEHQYAGLVQDLMISLVRHRALEASPGLVEEPEWWRDWLLGGGVAVGGLMVGGVLGAVIWRRISQGQGQQPWS